MEVLPIDDALSRRTLAVDHRGLSADGDGLFDRADSQVGIVRRDERSGKLDAFALHRGEARERERDRIGSGPKVLDTVMAAAVGNDRPHLLDQGGTGSFNGDTGEDGP